MEESDEINVLNEEAKEKFCVDVSVIKSVHKDQQASELQSLDLEVYDVKTFEDGVIAQVEEAIQKRTVEDGELSENSPPSKLQKTDNTDGLGSIEKYLRDQANLQKTKIKGPLEKQLKPKVHKKPQEFFPDKEVKEKKKGKFLGVKKRKKKEKLGTKYGESNSKCNIQPGEANYMYVNSSGSEYVPSSDDSEEERIVKKKKIKKTVSHILNSDIDTNDSNWSSDDEYSKKRKKGFELDDGNLDLFVKRTSCLEKELFKKFHRIDDEYKCPSTVWDQLYKYQKDAVKWFWGLNQERCGGILGDEMGLGKTIQLIAFLSGLYISNITDFDTNYTGLGPTLIVCPTTVMHQWVREFHKWLPPVRVAILHESGTFSGKDRSKLIDSIHNYGPGILITSYNGLVQYKDKMLKKNWHYVVLDEGHKIRNHSAQVTLVAKELYTPHRIILSGSPLQNNLRELWSLFDFIYPGKLGTLNVFIASFQVPIVQGGYTNASTFQVKTAFRCATILKDTITPYLLRRMKSEVEHHIHLPSKTEQVLFCKLTDIQRDFYKHFIESLDLEGIARGRVKIFVGLINLRKICNHPDLYSGGPYNDFKLVDNEDREKQFGYYDRAGKMIVIHKLLKIWFQQNHRVLIFTQSRKMLLIMENYIKNQEYKYLKLDGSTSISARQPMIDLFNREKSYFVMLLTTKVGGLGINLTGANRVIIYDPDWNPATDAQARERAWRIGQEKDVTIYRLITAGTIEEKMYHRQIFKQFLSNKVLKDPKQRRFFKSNDLFELFSLSETVKGGTNETAAIFTGTGSEVELKKPEGKLRDAIVLPQMTFSPSKIEEMKKFAQELSKKIGSKKEDVPSTSKQEVFYGPDGNLTVQNVPQKSIKKEKKGKNTFEGHVVPHLVKCKSVKKKEKPKTITQDEYVLHKLFSKSDIETALKHDTIMEGGPADYAIVEAEADKIAQDALKKLKESSVNIPQPRRINFITPLRNKSNFKEQLFQAINKRKLESNVSSPEMDLVKQIISWICSQGGTASTDSIVEEFAPKLGYEKNAIFKSILSQIAKFYRAPDKKGYWTIKDEFK